MQRVDLFLLPREQGDLCRSTRAEAQEWGRRHHGARSFLESVHYWTCCFHLRIGDSGRCSFPLCFDLSHSRAEISSMLDRVPLSLSQAWVI